MISIAHLLDDFASGGVTRSLSLFEDRRIACAARSSVVPMGRGFLNAPALDADLIVIHVPPCWSRLTYLVALRRRNPHARIVQVEHSYTRSFERMRVKSRARFRLLLRIAAGFVDEVVAVSQAQARWLAEVGLPKIKISTILPWSGRFELSRVADRSVSPGPARLLAYGRFSEEKNFGSLVQAISIFDPGEVELTLFGAGPEQEALVTLAKGMANVRIQPACPDPSPFLAHCDAVILPSHHEAFGLVATEARMAGRAILVADVDGLPEQAIVGGGIAAPLGTAEEIASAIRSLLRHDLGAMGHAARRSVSSQHDEIICGWMAVIERAVAPAAARSKANLNKLVGA